MIDINEKIEKMMGEMVKCPKCGEKTLYGDLTWLDGEQYCPNCYELEAKSKITNKKMKENQERLKTLVKKNVGRLGVRNRSIELCWN